MVNVPTPTTLDAPNDWQIIDQCLFGPDLRLRLVKTLIKN
jgi:diaminohydroxyphosphoribosylaminopyrimidine deaminase/5-amino-6-(5-phosphoribosylamino)uracil reductase